MSTTYGTAVHRDSDGELVGFVDDADGRITVRAVFGGELCTAPTREAAVSWLAANGRACTLLDVKAVIRTDDVQRTARWLWQLLGYAWLDTGDRWRVRSVGLYLARHGVLMTWPVAELTARLLGVIPPGRGAIARARDEFLTLAERVLTAEGARLPAG